MSLLIYSPRCKFSMEVIEYIKKHHQLKQLVHYHNINTQGIPASYKSKITRVPTMLTQNGKILVGNEIRNWLDSLLPTKEISNEMLGCMGLPCLPSMVKVTTLICFHSMITVNRCSHP